MKAEQESSSFELNDFIRENRDVLCTFYLLASLNHLKCILVSNDKETKIGTYQFELLYFVKYKKQTGNIFKNVGNLYIIFVKLL